MNKVDETVALLSNAGLLAAPRATEACGGVENMLRMYFEDNPNRTPQQAMEDTQALLRIRPLKGILETCKELKAIIPEIQKLVPVIQKLFESMQGLCPTKDGKPGACTDIITCLMSKFCPALCPTGAGECEGCDCFSQLCPDLCPVVPTPTPATAWYVLNADGKTTSGPFDLNTMKSMIGAKVLTKETKVAPAAAQTAWVAAGDEPTLKSLFA